MKSRLLPITFLTSYIVVLIVVLVFKQVPTIHLGMVRLNFGGVNEGAANLVPFKTIVPYVLGEKGLLIGGINILGNIILLVPLGFLMPFVQAKVRWTKILQLAAMSAFILESAQLILRVGRFDIDDVILNGLGVMLGYWLFVLLKDEKGKIKTSRILAISAAALVFAMCILFFLFSPAENSAANHSAGVRGTMQAGKDPCGGTGGLGAIIVAGKHSITVKRRDGVNETLFLNEQTKIMSSKGPAAESDLKIGVRVTVVVMADDKVANAVMICDPVHSRK